MRETREFRLHAAMLNHVISHQSGTPQKALLELVMNSVDAGATRVDVALGDGTFSVADDGRGIGTVRDLLAYWEVFGTPHGEGDAPFGTFRIGRGQIMSLAKVTFRTRRLEAQVDLLARPGTYDLVRHAADLPGMAVTGSWNARVRHRTLARSVAAELRRLCRWIAVEVTVNGERVSADPAAREWRQVTDEAYFELGLDEPLRVFNLGAFVCEFPPSRYGIGGEVVSRRRLALNTARNEILASTCPVWEAIERVILAQRNHALLGGVLTRESQRQAALGMAVRGEASLAEVIDRPIVTLAGGAAVTLRDVARARTLAVAGIAEAGKGEKLNGGGTLVLSAASARTLGIRGAADLVAMLRARAEEERGDRRLRGLRVGNPRIVSVGEEYERRVRLYAIRDASADLSRRDQARFAAIGAAHGSLVAALQGFGWRHLRQRTLTVARLVGALASTEGHRRISVDSGYLRRCLSRPGGMLGLAHTLVHEYAHSHLKAEDQHDFDFYRSVHDAWGCPAVVTAAWDMQVAADAAG